MKCLILLQDEECYREYSDRCVAFFSIHIRFTSSMEYVLYGIITLGLPSKKNSEYTTIKGILHLNMQTDFRWLQSVILAFGINKGDGNRLTSY